MRTDPKAQNDAHIKAADCRQVAAWLGIRSSGREYFCPACQTGLGHTKPALRISLTDFQCIDCGIKGGVVELIRKVRGCDERTADQWLRVNMEVNRPRRVGAEPTMVRIPTGGEFAAAHISGNPESRLPRNPEHTQIYRAFLDGCRRVHGELLKQLTDMGISEGVLHEMDVRVCGAEYEDLVNRLGDQYGEHMLTAAGLMGSGAEESGIMNAGMAELAEQYSDSAAATARHSIFWPYYTAKIPFLVMPYLLEGEPVFMRAKPLIRRNKRKNMGLARSLTLRVPLPCPYNVDALSAQGDSVLLLMGETETMIAMSQGHLAVGLANWLHFKPTWVDLFAAKKVTLVVTAEEPNDRGVRNITAQFEAVGLATPKWVQLPSGKSILSVLRDGSIAALAANRTQLPRPSRRGDDDALKPNLTLSTPPPPPLASSAERAARKAPARKPTVTEVAEAPMPEPTRTRTGAVPGTGSGKKGGDTFIAAVKAGPTGSILVYLREQDGQKYVRWRYWYFSPLASRWVPDRTLQFVVPAENARDLADAVVAAAEGRTLTEIPEWLQALREIKSQDQPDQPESIDESPSAKSEKSWANTEFALPPEQRPAPSSPNPMQPARG